MKSIEEARTIDTLETQFAPAAAGAPAAASTPAAARAPEAGSAPRAGSSGARWIAAIGVACFLIAPLWLVSSLASGYSSTSASSGTAELMVGIGVILRATTRRILHVGARGAMRTAISAALRAVTRTLTRRFSRLVFRSAVGAVTRAQLNLPSHLLPVIPHSRSIASLAVGTLALAASFGGSVYVAGGTDMAALQQHFGISLPLMVLLSALPMVVYAALIMLAGRAYGAETRFATEADGLLLQGYFTGGGSFLPMVTDMVIYGTPRQRGRVAFAALSLLLGCHLLLLVVAKLTLSGAAEFASSMFLLYTFIYSFPIHPLEGRAVWGESRGRWALLFVPTLALFLLAFPAALLEVV